MLKDKKEYLEAAENLQKMQRQIDNPNDQFLVNFKVKVQLLWGDLTEKDREHIPVGLRYSALMNYEPPEKKLLRRLRK